jgi:hypothetical protein
MPEIMSAKQASGTIDDIFCECTGYNGRCAFVEVQTFISSRDSAIIEKCKEAIIIRWAGVNKGTPNDALNDARLQSLVFALDSVISDINGGK